MSYRTQTRRRPNTSAPGDGSRTITVLDAQPQEEGTPSDGAAQPVLKLRGGPDTRPHVVWSEDVVDNEGLGKKKSKICCIYHKPKAFDESSDESDSDTESDSSAGDRARPPRHRHAHHHDHPHPHPHSSDPSPSGGPSLRSRDEGATVVQLEETSEPNAYEAQPRGSGKGKGKGKGKA